MVHMFNEGEGRRTYIHIHVCVYIYIETKIHPRNMGAIWGNRVIPCTGKMAQV